MINLVLDLDETLIHTIRITTMPDRMLAKKTNFNFKIQGQHYYVLKRPGLDLFLDFAFKYFNIGIWTAGDKQYATQICKNILKLHHLKRIKFIYSRNFCHLDRTSNPPMFTKPLVKIFELYPTFKPTNTIIIDNTYHVMKFNPQNAVNIPDFIDDTNDQYLYHIRNIIVKYYQKVPMKTPIWALTFQLNKYLSII